jgi:hypothetical protein
MIGCGDHALRSSQFSETCDANGSNSILLKGKNDEEARKQR